MTATTKKRSVGNTLLTGRQFLNNHVHSKQTTLLVAVAAGTFSTLLMLTQWLSFSFISEKVIVENALLEEQTSLLIMLICSFMGRALLTRMQTLLSQKASLNVRHNIRRTMLAHWRISSPIYLIDKSTGAFATQFVEDVESMDGYFSRYWPQQALAIISPLLIVSVIAYLNWVCAFILVVAAPLIPLFMILVGMSAEKLNQQYSTVRQRLSGHFLDRVSNLLNIRLLGAEQVIFEEVQNNSQHYRKIVMKTLKVAFLSSTVLEFFTSIAIAALAIYIGFSLYGAITWGPANNVSLFTGLTILILAPEFFQPLRNLSQFYHDRASALGAANNLVELLGNHANNHCTDKSPINKSTKSNQADPCQLRTHKNKTRLKLSNLAIGYECNHQLIQKLNAELTSGDLLVVSGNSGTGKTTLLNTIAGFVPALAGSLSITPSNNSMAYLPQQAWIKNDTVYENLAALAPKATKNQMCEVLDRLGLASELALKHKGLDTHIGEHGQGLSGGQMQRIALARMLLNPTPVVLLDEPTAKLDALSKKYIINALTILKPEVILVIATHDPSLIDISDMHINLNDLEE
jgi:ATP-binding cassette subfamily C protein CydD